MHPQYRFIPFRFVNYAALHSSSIMSAALNIFSGCSFAQPSGLAPLALCPKSRYAKGWLIFLPRRYTLLSLHFTSLSLRFILGLAWLFDCRNTATALLEKTIISAIATIIIFLRCLGVFDCRFQKKHPKKKSKQETSCYKKINKKKVKLSSGFKK
jgi:hypothetical protein